MNKTTKMATPNKEQQLGIAFQLHTYGLHDANLRTSLFSIAASDTRNLESR